MRRTRWIAITTIFLAACVSLRAQLSTGEHASLASPSASAADASGGPAGVFVENRGQFDPVVRYKLTTQVGAIWLTSAGVVFDGVREARAGGGRSANSASAPPAKFGVPTGGLARPVRIGLEADAPERAVFSEAFVGANPNAVLQAADLPAGTYDNSTGTDAARSPASVRAFSNVEYRNVWPDISVRLVASSMGIGQQFIVQPGANTANIAVSYEGVDSMTIDEQGSLVIATPLGTFREGRPQIYQELNGSRIAVSGQYILTGLGTYGFQLEPYAHEYPLVISPTMAYFSRASAASTGAPVINYFSVSPTSMLPRQAAVTAFLVSGATYATVNNILAHCGNGQCGGTAWFYPTCTTNYVLQANGDGGTVSASQLVEVGQYQPNPPPQPAGLKVTWQGACWMKSLPKRVCNGACQSMAFQVDIPNPPARLPLEATLYLGTTTCNPSRQDNLNDTGATTGSGGWIYGFIHYPNRINSSAIFTIGNQSSGCVSYAKAPVCNW